jgi:hypothetical protein
MEKIGSISHLFKATINSNENEWIYTNLETWNTTPKKCDFYIISEAEIDDLPDEEVYESQAGPYLPITLQNLNLSPWMEIAVLQGVIQNLKLKDGDRIDDDLLIDGINYYREYDDFMDV